MRPGRGELQVLDNIDGNLAHEPEPEQLGSKYKLGDSTHAQSRETEHCRSWGRGDAGAVM